MTSEESDKQSRDLATEKASHHYDAKKIQVLEGIEAVRRRQPAVTGFVNAVLRRFIRERETLRAGLAGDDEAVHEHPRWWINRVRADWPGDWRQRLAAANRLIRNIRHSLPSRWRA